MVASSFRVGMTTESLWPEDCAGKNSSLLSDGKCHVKTLYRS
jgi:hypothetical protein